MVERVPSSVWLARGTDGVSPCSPCARNHLHVPSVGLDCPTSPPAGLGGSVEFREGRTPGQVSRGFESQLGDFERLLHPEGLGFSFCSMGVTKTATLYRSIVKTNK